ncbi:MAG: transcription elongation factor GreA [Alphaproteobacteria bacterium]|nr:transcription elongation factor GreA [Alphaproteobacteria bacterium]
MEKKPISKAGFDALQVELKRLKEIDRPDIIKTIQWARSLGDLSENADYSGAKEKQRIIDRRIRFLEDTIRDSQVVDIDSLSGDRVMFGATVVAEDQDGIQMQCRILSETEADGKMVIACTSPVGRALMGKCVGDVCIVRTPGGEKEYEILEVKFK